MKSMQKKRVTIGFIIYKRTDLSLNDIANEFNPVLRGWIEYYGKYNRSALSPVLGILIRLWLHGQSASIKS